jgi:colanic acid/amylovoran biosynthesis glycosyltransferase
MGTPLRPWPVTEADRRLEQPSRLRVAYVMSRFPKLTETFVLNEILAVERQGVTVDIYPLLRERPGVLQPGAAELVARAHYTPFMSRAILGSQIWALRRGTRSYLGALVTALRETWGSPRFLVGALAYFPKAVHLARLISDAGAGHVHCHFANHPALVGFVIGRLTGLPWSFTAHGSDLHIDKHMLCRKTSEASFVVAISRSNRDVILAECRTQAENQVEVIHCGIDTNLFRPAGAQPAGAQPAVADPGAHPRSLRLVSVGTLHEVKGQRYLIEACARLRDEGVDVTCQIVGDGPDESRLAARIRELRLEDRVRLAGRLTRDAVIEILQLSDVLVAPSVPSREGRLEGLPVVIMEAMGCGLPVVASRLSGIPELVIDDRTGYLVEPRDVAGIAAALLRLADDPRLRWRLGAEARAEVERDFEVNECARRLIARMTTSRPALASGSLPAEPVTA